MSVASFAIYRDLTRTAPPHDWSNFMIVNSNIDRERTSVGPVGGSARPAGPSDRASSLGDSSRIGSHGCGADVFLREPHAQSRVRGVEGGRRGGCCRGGARTALLDGHFCLGHARTLNKNIITASGPSHS